MSDNPFLLPQPPLMTPEKARDLGRAYKAMAEHFVTMEAPREAARMERESQWWLTYAIALSQTPESGKTDPSP